MVEASVFNIKNTLCGGYIVKPVIIQRLLQSITELESAIANAKLTFKDKGDAGVQLLERVAHYEDILNKQKQLTTALCTHAIQGNWEEVNRHVKLINAYSLMIRDDARELLQPQLANHIQTYHAEFVS